MVLHNTRTMNNTTHLIFQPPLDFQTRTRRAPNAPRIPEQDWLSHRSTIESLYQKCGQTLDQVMQTMWNEKSFSASKRQYTKKLREWGCFKYNVDQATTSKISKSPFEQEPSQITEWVPHRSPRLAQISTSLFGFWRGHHHAPGTPGDGFHGQQLPHSNDQSSATVESTTEYHRLIFGQHSSHQASMGIVSRRVIPSMFLNWAEHTYLEHPLQDLDIPQVERLAQFLEAADAYDDAFRLRWMIHINKRRLNNPSSRGESKTLIGLAKCATYGYEYNSAPDSQKPPVFSPLYSSTGTHLLASYKATINVDDESADLRVGRCLSALEEFISNMANDPSKKRHIRTQFALECNAVIALESLGHRTNEAVDRMSDRKQKQSSSILSPPNPSAALFADCVSILREDRFQQILLHALERVHYNLPAQLELGHTVPSILFCHFWLFIRDLPSFHLPLLSSSLDDCTFATTTTSSSSTSSSSDCACQLALSDFETLAVISQHIASTISSSGVWQQNTPTLPKELLREALLIQKEGDSVRGFLFTNFYLERLRNKERKDRAVGLASGLKEFLRGFLDEHFVLDLSHAAADALGL